MFQIVVVLSLVFQTYTTIAMTLWISMPAGGELILILGLVMTIVFINYLMTLSTITRAISLENRKISPGEIWLLLIPLFNLFWHFIVVKRLDDSIKAEAVSKEIQITSQQGTYNAGLAMCILGCLSVSPFLGHFFGIGSLICWIIYWSNMIGIKKRLPHAGHSNSGNSII